MKKTTKLIMVNIVLVILFGRLHYVYGQSITCIIVQAILGTVIFWLGVCGNKSK